jgi:hypothetical protein
VPHRKRRPRPHRSNPTGDLISHALTMYPFRDPQPDESDEHYMHAVVAHVRAHDMGLAFELVVGRRQADWTPDQVTAFHDFMTADFVGPREDFTTPQTIIGLRIKGVPISPESLRAQAERDLAFMMGQRTRRPTETPAIMVSVLDEQGEYRTTVVPNRDDRLATLKALVRKFPVYGFVVVADIFLHSVDKATNHARKQDALIAHVGTRDRLYMLLRPYHVTPQGVVFDPPMPDLEMTADMVSVYRDVFVTVPPTSGLS